MPRRKLHYHKPIKGTRPRGQNITADQTNKNELANSEKDITENVMIVDLLRNDLGKYAKTGTVKFQNCLISKVLAMYHMVSTITATLKDNISPWTVLFENLPAWLDYQYTQKRAVKKSSMNWKPNRGAYCGTMGYLNFDGTGAMECADSDVTKLRCNVSLWAGSGIAIASRL